MSADKRASEMLSGLPVSLSFPQPAPYVSVQRERLEQMEKTLKEQDKLLKRIGTEPQIVGMVLSVSDERAYISGPSGAIMVPAMPGVDAGARVFLNNNTNAILGVVPKGQLPPTGMIATIERLGQSWSIRGNSGECAVIVPSEIEATLVPGDRVIVDATGMAVLANLGKTETRYTVEHTPLHWDDIGGCAQAKQALREAVEYPITHADLYAAYRKKPSRGVLLYGGPGCGKTLLGRATATAVSGGKGPDPFIYVKGPELRSKWVGETEANIRRLFDRARAHKQATGRAAVIFIDEADALLSVRDAGGLASNDSVTVVPQFLAEMDGLQDSSAFVLLSTNVANGLDPAIVRDGRIDRKVHVPRPDRASSADIFRLCLRGQAGDTEELGAQAIEIIFSDDVVVTTANTIVGPVTLHLRDVLSGAVIAGIVGRGIENAITRDRENAAKEPSGLNASDLRHGVFLAARELASTNLHQDFIDKIHATQPKGN